MFAQTCVFDKQSLLPGLCHHHPYPVKRFRTPVPLLPKLRGYFAEFLNHDSLERLGILYPTTCVGLGYGRLEPHVEAFLGTTGSPYFPHKNGHHPASPTRSPDLPGKRAALLNVASHKPRGSYHCASPLLTRLPTTGSVPTLTTPPNPKERKHGSDG